uniref:Neuronal acetylcholine receptor subunit alpha-9-like n=1 Tax=Kryptolebias marmoratus TaxID=37003 RepID=A0A3Q3AME2_KRYMA
MKVWCLVVHLNLFFFSSAVCFSAHGRFAQKLLSDLFSNYTNALRPVEDTDNIINVTLQITLSQIIDMDERNQILTTYLWIRQQCHLTFGSWTHNGNQMDLINALDSADLADFVPNVEWEKNVILYGCCSDPYPDITFTLHLKRRASFYIFNLLIPCMMISFLAPLGFYLPADSGEKISLGVTVLLALTVFQLLVAESMPPSESVPLIGKYYIATMTMVTASTALTIFIMNIHHCGSEAQPVPQWAERFVLKYLAKICFVSEVGESCFRGASSKKQPLSQEESDVPSSGDSRGTNWDVNGQAWGGRGEDEGREASVREEQVVTKQSLWKEDLFVTIDHSAGGRGEGGEEKKGGGVPENPREILVRTQCVCQHQKLRKNIEFIANSYQDQRAAQLRIGEWRKIAKVMDRFFMWLFFIMFFFMSVLILGKAI